MYIAEVNKMRRHPEEEENEFGDFWNPYYPPTKEELAIMKRKKGKKNSSGFEWI